MTGVNHEGGNEIGLGLLHRFGGSLNIFGAVVGSVGSSSKDDVDVLLRDENEARLARERQRYDADETR